VIVRCTIATNGAVKDCKMIKGVPILQEIVLCTLNQSRYTPVTYQGRPEAVQYVFTFNFKLPNCVNQGSSKQFFAQIDALTSQRQSEVLMHFSVLELWRP